jgi:Ca2+-binding EF-hand superfamily protein
MRKLAALCLAAALWAAPALAEDIDGAFKLLDKDLDGKITRAESKYWKWPPLKHKWSDLNSDGVIDPREFREWMADIKVRKNMLKLDEAGFSQMDADKDGLISYVHECWCTEDLFRRLDNNKDGYLSRPEAFRKDPNSRLRVIKQRKKKSK